MSPLAGLRHFLASHTEMSSANTHGAFPAMPSSLNPRDHEMHDYYTNDPKAVPANTNPYYTPYLGLRARLSQTWINKWTILLLLVLCRVLLAVQNLKQNIDSAKTEALSACSSVENVGSAMASMPHYLSQGVNELAADGVTKAVNGLMEMLTLTVTGVEEIILFYINMLTSTYVCLITLVIGGSLHAAIEMIEMVGSAMNESIASITSSISSDVSTFQNGLNSFLSSISGALGLFGNSQTVPKLDITSHLSALNSIQINPTSMDQDLNNLENHIPTFDQVQNFTNNLISLPFEEIKSLINSTYASYTFDKSVFPVAQKQALTFCSNNNGIDDFFNGLQDLAELARKIFTAIVIILAILACVPMAYREIWQWRTMQKRARLLQKNSFDPIDVLYIATRPYTSTAGIKAASKFKSPKRQILTRWFIAYATSVPALFVLTLGVAGLFSALCQVILVRAVEKQVPALAEQVGDFTEMVVNALNNASEAWAVSANKVISDTNDKINEDVFGWVVNATTAANNTLNGFMDQVNNAINQTFGGTILYDPINGAIKCLLGLKVDSVEKGLTWVHDHAHVTFPEFRNDTFSLGAVASLTNSSAGDSFLSSPGSVASDDITNALVKVTNAMEDAIRQETFIAAFLVGIWFVIVLMGLTRALIGMIGRDKTHAEGGPVGYAGDNRNSTSPQDPNYNEAKFPGFGSASPAHMGKDSVDDGSWSTSGLGVSTGDEKIGQAGHRFVARVLNNGHERSSSHGYMGGEKR
jgi:hypothetical protein